MISVYMLPEFARWAKKEKVTHNKLISTALEVVKGLHDGDLGANCYKKDLPLKGKESGQAVEQYCHIALVIFWYTYMLMPKMRKAIFHKRSKRL
nr:type II toxin-antitoxin system RelE/ParE family toxin [Facilibium subflavum]